METERDDVNVHVECNIVRLMRRRFKVMMRRVKKMMIKITEIK